MKKMFTRYFSLTSFLFISSLLILMSCGSSRRSVAVEEGWDLIAEKKVNFVRDKDEIRVSGRVPYSAIRFKVEDRDIRINDVKIYFDNGDKLEPSMDDVVAADQYSREITLASEGKYIDRIEFKYRTTGNILKGRGNVLLFGQKSYNAYPGRY